MSGSSETQSGAVSGARENDQAASAPGEHRPTPSPNAPQGAVPRAGAPRPSGDHGPGWGPGAGGPAAAASSDEAPPAPDQPQRADRRATEQPTPEQPTTVLPGAAGAGARRPGPARPAVGGRPVPRGEGRAPLPAAARPTAGRTRRAKLALRRIDPWSVFLFSLIASIFLGVALVVAVAVLYSVLGRLGVTDSMNQLFAEVTGGDPLGEPLLTTGRIVGGAAVLAALNVVFLTLLATLGALLYNLCASFTGGVELTLGERE